MTHCTSWIFIGGIPLCSLSALSCSFYVRITEKIYELENERVPGFFWARQHFWTTSCDWILCVRFNQNWSASQEEIFKKELSDDPNQVCFSHWGNCMQNVSLLCPVKNGLLKRVLPTELKHCFENHQQKPKYYVCIFVFFSPFSKTKLLSWGWYPVHKNLTYSFEMSPKLKCLWVCAPIFALPNPDPVQMLHCKWQKMPVMKIMFAFKHMTKNHYKFIWFSFTNRVASKEIGTFTTNISSRRLSQSTLEFFVATL